MSCPNCGMYLPASPADIGPNMEFIVYEGPVWHECPPPFSRDIAEYLYDFYATTGIPTSSLVKARIRLGMR